MRLKNGWFFFFLLDDKLSKDAEDVNPKYPAAPELTPFPPFKLLSDETDDKLEFPSIISAIAFVGLNPLFLGLFTTKFEFILLCVSVENLVLPLVCEISI